MTTTNANAGLSRGAMISIGIFAALLVLVLSTREERVAVGIRKLSLPVLDKDKIESIEIGGKHKAVLTKKSDGWKVANPEAADKMFPADTAAVERALEKLEELSAGSFVTARKEKHEELEVNDEKGTFVTFKEKDGKSLAVVLGRYAKGGGNYIRLHTSDEVFVGKGALAGQVRKDADKWRKKKLFDFSANAMAEVKVKAAGKKSYTIVQPTQADDDSKGSGSWSLKPGTALPEGFKIDTSSLTRIATTLAGLRAADFVDDKVPDAELGFSGPDASVIEGRIRAGAAVRVVLGKTKDKKVYTRVDEDPQVYLISEYTAKNLRKGLLDHRDLSFVKFDAAKVTGVRIIHKNKAHPSPVALSKDASGWRMTAPALTPPGYEFDAAGVPGKLSGLTRLRAAEFLGAEGEVKAKFSGKKAKALKIELTLDDNTTRTLVMGGIVPGEDGKNSKNVFASVGDGFVYAIGKYQKERYEKALDVFKKVEPPPTPPGGGMGGMGGLGGMNNLPPEIRKQLEAQLKAGNFPGKK